MPETGIVTLNGSMPQRRRGAPARSARRSAPAGRRTRPGARWSGASSAGSSPHSAAQHHGSGGRPPPRTAPRGRGSGRRSSVRTTAARAAMSSTDGLDHALLQQGDERLPRSSRACAAPRREAVGETVPDVPALIRPATVDLRAAQERDAARPGALEAHAGDARPSCSSMRAPVRSWTTWSKSACGRRRAPAVARRRASSVGVAGVEARGQRGVLDRLGPERLAGERRAVSRARTFGLVNTAWNVTFERERAPAGGTRLLLAARREAAVVVGPRVVRLGLPVAQEPELGRPSRRD